MSIPLLQERLETYNCRTAEEEEQALREMTQEVILAALGRSDFFAQAAFHGGTCLRIHYGLNRFSEDLDFALLEPNPRFDLTPFLKHVADELSAYGYRLELQDRSSEAVVKKAFLKDDSIGRILELQHLRADRSMKKIRIKLEVDTNPPAHAGVESKYLNFPFLSSVTVHDQPSLFAGKLHALLCREYLKGRDWYDLLWYSARRSEVNLPLLQSALIQSGPWQGSALNLDTDWLRKVLLEKIGAIDWKQAANDVRRFLKPEELPSLELWSVEAFNVQVDLLFPVS
ncbi:MAG: nucleotidyl transferase AbiEii/AbiGii toxin family protein [Planctomycetota bacterium]|jgi:predicted nucleotidyltransferase component of viral defense system